MTAHEGVRGLKGSWEWMSLATTMPAKAVPLPGISAGYLAAAGRYVLTGASGLNLSTANGHVDVYDGQDTTGGFVWRFSVSNGSTVTTALPNRGVLLESGCYVVPSGIVFSGSVLLIPLWDYPWSAPGD